ncbi:peptidase domain-containing ABC transporter [Treponema sp. HNW]|uniref:peptidase domain-containing ABC transporter n=1 Tax=Treponema sp. HNW TaxID=3116654 RepID=UPI003D0DB355
MNITLKRNGFILQHDESDCAPACLASLCKYYGKRIPISFIRRLAGTDREGTSGNGIIRGAEELGFSCKGAFSETKELDDRLIYPLIAHVLYNRREHYVIVYGSKKNKVKIGDPAEGIKWLKKTDFQNIWTGVFFIAVPLETFQKNTDTDTSLTRFIRILKPHKKICAEVCIASIILSFLGIASAFYFRFLIDEILYTGIKIGLTLFSLGYALVIFFQTLLSFSRSQLMLHMSNKIDTVMMTGYFRHILKLPMDFFTSRKTGELLSRINDTSTIRYAISSASLSVLLDSLMLIIGGVFLCIFGGNLIIAAAIPVILCAILAWLFFKPYKRLLRIKAVVDADKQSSMVENINGIATIKALSSEQTAYEHTEMKIVDSIKRGISLGTMGNTENALHFFLVQSGTLAVYWLGSLRILAGTMSLGQLISFVLLSGYFLGPLGRLLTLQPTLQEALVAASRLAEILDIPEEKRHSGSFKKNELKGDIDITGLSFAYGTRGNTLENIELHIEAGEKAAFVGSSGSGKTTLTKLLMKFHNYTQGEILVDGIHLREYDTESYRSLIGYVPQDILLFSGTIKENIRFGMPYADDEQVYKAAQAAHADEFIAKLPEGYDTLVGERGTTLSGGERQRLALARILLRRPKLMILDEATSSLDSVSEKAVMSTINEMAKSITAIIVAHRLSSIIHCDKIFVFEHGRVVESGTHKSLLRKNGVYTKLWLSQQPVNAYPKNPRLKSRIDVPAVQKKHSRSKIILQG